MKKLLFLFFPLLVAAHPLPNDCGGVYRWDNKILIDLPGLDVFHKRAKSTTIFDLNEIPKPPQSQLGKNRSAPEQKKVTVTAWLVGLGEEDNDEDYHLILTGLNSKDSLIAEIPNPTCPKLQGFSGLREKYSIARKFIEDNVDESPGAVHYLPEGEKIKVKVTGVVFFDKHAHGNGHSRNDVEIHPVLKIVRAN